MIQHVHAWCSVLRTWGAVWGPRVGAIIPTKSCRSASLCKAELAPDALPQPALLLVAGVLRFNRKLTRLDLSKVNVDVPSAQALRTALAENSSLTFVNISFGAFVASLQGVEAIAEGVCGTSRRRTHASV